MPYETIGGLLAGDIASDRTALQVYNAAKTSLKNKWGNAAGVPKYLYMPLREILFGATGTPAQLRKAVVQVYGTGQINAERSIQITTMPVEVQEKDPDGSDDPGVELAQVKILTQLHSDVKPSDVSVLKQTDLRIRYLIDCLWRQKRFKTDKLLGITPHTIPRLESTDPTIDPDYPFLCQWKGWLVNDSVMYKASLYWAQYMRAVL